MDRYDLMSDIPPSIEKRAWEARNIQRALAYAKGEPYCFDCDRKFVNHVALWQHRRDKHPER